MPIHRKAFIIFLALLAFAGNSVLCRLALADGVSDPVSFTILRLLSGAITLCFLFILSRGLRNIKQAFNCRMGGSWWAAVCLLIYALLFSIAYTVLDTGMGALILFGAVQITMIGCDLIKGRKLALIEWMGILMAVLGIVYLLWPAANINSAHEIHVLPFWLGGAMMLVSGIAWGLYSVAGASSDQAIANTAANFLRTLPLLLLVLPLFFLYAPVVSSQGVIYAVVSGAITSGLGYAIWYAVLPFLASTQAAIVQLLVPIVAAIGGVLFVQESLTIALAFSSFLVLGGVLLVMARRVL
ncbi:DMT family transporter [Eionea flava]